MLEIDVAIRGIGKVAFKNQRRAVTEDRRSHDAFEKGVDRNFPRDPALFGERHAFTEAENFDDQSHVDGDFELDGEALGADVADLRADREKHRLNALERCPVTGDHE